MCKRIPSVSVSVPNDPPAMELQFHPGINILWGQHAENIVLSLLFGSEADGWSFLDGSRLPNGLGGASDLLLKKLRETLAKVDDRPLFIYNFLERLDEAVALQPLFEALSATGRQVFIAVPHYYKIHTQEEIYHDTAIHII